MRIAPNNMKELEICSCGKSCYRKEKEQTRAEVICHCDACGIKWGEHNYPFEVNLKEICVVCGGKIKHQNEERYYDKGNYCDKCNGEAGNRAGKTKIDIKFEDLFKNKIK